MSQGNIAHSTTRFVPRHVLLLMVVSTDEITDSDLS